MLTLEENKKLIYPKIETAFNRGKDFNFLKTIHSNQDEACFPIPSLKNEYYVLRKPEFNCISQWEVTEKIDGTNVRIILKDQKLYFAGKTEKAELPNHLLEKLKTIFTEEKLLETFEGKDVTLYGEGFGAKIQGGVGEKYSHEAEFILFDIRIGNYWLLYNDLEKIASKLGINVVPLLGYFDMETIVKMVTDGFPSKMGDLPICEGIIAKTKLGLNDRNNDRIIFKLKHKDFNKSFKPHKQ